MTWLTPIEIGLVQGLLMAGAVVGFAVAFRLFGFPDLTIEASVPLAAGTYAVLTQLGIPAAVGVITAVTVGSACGAMTAWIHTRFGVNKFLAGILVVSVGYTLTLRLMDGPNVSLLQSGSVLRTTEVAGLSLPERFAPLLLLLLLWSLITGALLRLLGTRYGIGLRAAGSNPGFAQAIGLSPRIAAVIGLALCNSMAALSGVLQADYQGFADVGSGQGVLVLALAAMALGEAVVPRRSISYFGFVVIAAVAGSLVYHVILAIAVRAGLAPTDLRLATALLVLMVVTGRWARDNEGLMQPGDLR